MRLEEVFGLAIIIVCYALVITCDVIAGTAYLAQVRETERRL